MKEKYKSPVVEIVPIDAADIIFDSSSCTPEQ